MARSFNLDAQSALMLGTDPAAALGNYLGPVGKIFGQILPILVIRVSSLLAVRTVGGNRAKSGTRGFSLFGLFGFHNLINVRREFLLRFLLFWRTFCLSSWASPLSALPPRRVRFGFLLPAPRAYQKSPPGPSRLFLGQELSCR